ncbi:MAG: hypothetical protein ACTHLT_12805 [Devosia sp.]
MTDSHNVPTNVPADVPTPEGRRPAARAPRYLSGDPSGWRFQIRVPARFIRADSFLARPSPILRMRLGALPRKAAEPRAELCAALCRAVFATASGKKETSTMQGLSLDNNERDLLEQVMAACQQGIASAIAAPEQALGLARGLESALSTLNLVATERQRGDAGNAAIRAGADGMVREALRGVLTHARDPSQAETVLARLPNLMSPAPHNADAAPVAPRPSGSGVPTFGEVSQGYIDMRIGVDGAEHPDVKILRMRRQTFLDLIGDRPVDGYTPADLQNYVTAMQYWPANSTKRSQFQGMTTQQVLDANRGLQLAPLKRKSLQDGYVANIRTMMRYWMAEKGYRDPFAGVRLRWPRTAAPPVKREEIGIDIVNRVFELGVESGLLLDAMLPPLARLTARRLGLLIFLRGSDIRLKHGVHVAQTGGIIFVDGAWRRVPIKTDASAGFFVLHNFLAEIGYLKWAMDQGDGWLFPEAHEHPDPSRYVSKIANRLLRAAGATGGAEVFHSLRGDGITGLRSNQLPGRTARLQAGHELGDVHDRYGLTTLTAEECRRLASLPLESAINWDRLTGLNYEELA